MPAPQWLRDLDDSVKRYTTTGVRWLIYANLGIWIVYVLLRMLFPVAWEYATIYLACTPLAILRGFVWQLATYMFLHDTQTPFHILFNMLMLWFIGPILEQIWGRREFLRFYLICGIGAAAVYEVVAIVRPMITDYPILVVGPGGIMIGASAAIYGLLFAFGYLFPDQPVLFGMLIPMPARVMVALLILLSFLASIDGAGDHIADFAHLSGMLVAFVYLKWRGGGRPVRVVRMRETTYYR